MANYQANRIKNRLNDQRTQIETLEEAMEANPLLKETYEAAAAALLAVRAEDVGWTPLNKIQQDNGFTLENVQEIGEYAEIQTTGNPLLLQGLRLRTSNVFGRGVRFESDGDGKLAPRFQRILDKPVNQNALFTQDAFTRNSRELYTKGNLMVCYQKSTQNFFAIPFEQITNSAANPVLEDDIWYYQRTYQKVNIATGQPDVNPTVEWIPVLERTEMKDWSKLKRIGQEPVNQDFVIVDLKVNMPIGHTWGVPDCLAAMPYAWAHAEYIRDASKLLKALSTIAWKVVAKGKANATNAAAKAAGPRPGAAQTAVMDSNTDLVAMPRSGQVDMKDGQTIASYVASALGVSLVALLSDPGAASGSYGAAATLDGPSADVARARQDTWRTFYQRIFRVIGVTDIEVNFPKLSEDPVHRQAQTLTLLRTTGALYADEYRQAALEAISMTPIHSKPPKPEEYAPAANGLAYLKMLQDKELAEEEAQRAEEALNDPNPRQGNSGVAGQFDSGSNELRDEQRTPGTGS